MKKRFLMILLLFLLSLGCSSGIEGNYICKNDLISIHKENDQTILKIINISPTAEISKPKETLSLIKNDNVYTASILGFSVSVSKAEEGIMFVGLGKSETCKSIDLEKGKSNLNKDTLKKQVQTEFFDIIIKDMDSKSYQCGSYGLSKNKREHLKELIGKKDISIKINEKKEHLLFDEYSYESKISFPEVKAVKESKICTKKKYVWGREKCVSWGKGEMETSTKPYSMIIRGTSYAPRYSEISNEIRTFYINSINDNNKSYRLNEVFCKDLFLSKDALNYEENIIKK